MAAIVFAFPPIRIIGAEWTIEQPVNVSRGMWSGRRITSGALRARKVAALRTRSFVDDGAGYVEALKELLEGGEHLVRLNALPVNDRALPLVDGQRQSWPLTYRSSFAMRDHVRR